MPLWQKFRHLKTLEIVETAESASWPMTVNLTAIRDSEAHMLTTMQVASRITSVNTWRAPWKNQISSTTMKLRKSPVKPVMRQNISSCLVLPPEVFTHDAFNVILWTSTNICIVMHDDLTWKNQTTWYNCMFSATSLALRVISSAENVRRYMHRVWRSRVEEPNNML